ncbi:hypothetical protein GALMADRAFT_229943 [Galerina marginata CBS 339.88]|uniref:MYND-type domain-containing protein n=1 Tax=Galerina marginata (strain CBS 339.88) TaxID=685588 RepID=A0A067SSA0_GALM3|nr:hypothetical protein GALMADRAFT_229943 [Galerina marginata CBS 339.88]
MATGFALFLKAETFYGQGRNSDAFEYYQKSIKKILKDEDITANLSIRTDAPLLPPDCPRELLANVWRNFLALFRGASMNFTKESHPEAYKLLDSFRPTTRDPTSHARFERTPQGKVLLKGLQISAGLTLGLLAWDKRDRATAAKRYREALDLAQTHLPFTAPSPSTVGFERYVYAELQQAKDNLEVLVQNDTTNAALAAATGGDGQVPGRRDEVDLLLPQRRIEKTGEVTMEHTVAFATNVCANCGKRDPKLLRCTVCRTTLYCNGDCQRAHWPVHKRTCTGRGHRS